MENAGLRRLGSIAIDLANTEHVSYIRVPYGKLFCVLLRLTQFMSVLYLLSANLFLAFVLLPVYAIMLYLFYQSWLIAKRYALRLLPVLFVVFALNIPCAILAVYLRNWIIGLF